MKYNPLSLWEAENVVSSHATSGFCIKSSSTSGQHLLTGTTGFGFHFYASVSGVFLCRAAGCCVGYTLPAPLYPLRAIHVQYGVCLLTRHSWSSAFLALTFLIL